MNSLTWPETLVDRQQVSKIVGYLVWQFVDMIPVSYIKLGTKNLEWEESKSPHMR